MHVVFGNVIGLLVIFGRWRLCARVALAHYKRLLRCLDSPSLSLCAASKSIILLRFSTANRAELSEPEHVPLEPVLTTRRCSDIGSVMTNRAVFDVVVLGVVIAAGEAPSAAARVRPRVAIIRH